VFPAPLTLRRRAPCWLLSAALALTGCASAPVHVKPETPTPSDWGQWRSGDDALHPPVATDRAWPLAWWTVLGDPVLDELERRAVTASPDLRTAAIRFAQSRTQRGVVETQQGPQVRASAGAVRQRQSEYGAGTRLLDAIGGDRDRLAALLSEPFTLYQAGFDASWEPDLWGRVSQAVAAADADVASQAALLGLARLTLASDVARHCVEFRAAQEQSRIVREDIAAQQERIGLLEARVRAGVLDPLGLEPLRADLAASQGQLPALLMQQAAAVGQIELLLGERPGALRESLAKSSVDVRTALPELALGLPSEVAQRRPDIQAAEARLRRATANIGVAKADLYPTIRLGAKFGAESTVGSEFANWSSRTWSVGPTLDLPLFDRGRRMRVVQLRELEQQEAAVAYQRTVLQAWHEIDDALNAYAAERQHWLSLQLRESSIRQVHALAMARYRGGTVDYSAVLDARRSLLQAGRERMSSEDRLKLKFVALNKAIAAVPTD
jgi:NodT family efflux transporter outer membrane factor (OMF) lipoprotein